MNDVNLSGASVKLVSANDRTQSKALSSSRSEGKSVSAPGSLPADRAAASTDGRRGASVSEAKKLENQSEQQREQLSSAVSQLNDYVQNVQRDLKFEVNSELGQTIVRVVDQQTQEVIRQIPDEVALRLAEKLQQDEPLTLFNVKV